MGRQLKSIVIGTSLTDSSDAVVEAGVALARATGATPWLIHAYLPYPAYVPTASPSGGTEDRLSSELVGSLRQRISEQARRTGFSAFAGSADRTLLALGPPHLQIVDLAYRAEADLIMVGAGEADGGALGSIAERVIRKAPCPVLAVRPQAAFPPTRVEISVDFSPISADALAQGLDLLAQLGVPLRETEVLFVLDPFEMVDPTHFTREQIQRFADEELRRFVAAKTPDNKRPGMARVRTGYAREEILAALTERSADLAVLGTHGRSGFERLVLGSVVSGVLRNARCNLLVVPPLASRTLDDATAAGVERAGADWRYVSDEAPVDVGRSAVAATGSTSMEVTFPGGLSVDAQFKGLTFHTDQPVAEGGGGTAPSPFDLFLASIGTCAGFYVLRFCRQRGIDTEGLSLQLAAERDGESGRIATVRLELCLPEGFPARYRGAVVRAADHCAVKRHILEPPRFEVVAVETHRALSAPVRAA